MLRYLVIFLAALFLVLLQTSLLPLLTIKGVWPNFVLMTLLALRFANKVKTAYLVAILSGTFLDLTTQTLFGLNSLLFVLFLTSSAFYMKIFGEGLLQNFFLGFLSSMLLRIIFSLPFIVIGEIFLGGILDGMLLTVLFPLISGIISILSPKAELQLSFKDKL